MNWLKRLFKKKDKSVKFKSPGKPPGSADYGSPNPKSWPVKPFVDNDHGSVYPVDFFTPQFGVDYAPSNDTPQDIADNGFTGFGGGTTDGGGAGGDWGSLDTGSYSVFDSSSD